MGSVCRPHNFYQPQHSSMPDGQARPDLDMMREGLRPLVFEGVRRTADADMRTLLANLQARWACTLGSGCGRWTCACSWLS